MGRSPCCSKEGLNRGAWTHHEDKILTAYIKAHGEGKWRNLPKRAGLKRCGKSCRLRWLNYLRPDIKRGNISSDEEDLIIRLHKLLGNRWSLIAGRLPGRTDNEIKNYWNTNISKKVQGGHPSCTPNRKPSNHSKQKPVPMRKQSAGHLPTPNTTVVRTKASKCTRVFINAEPQDAHNHSLLEYSNPAVVGPSTIQGCDCDGVLGPDQPVIFMEDEENPSNFMLDFEMDDTFLSDFLNTDFSLPLCDFDSGLINGSAETSASFSSSSDSNDQNLFFSSEMLQADSDLQSMGSPLNPVMEWLKDQ